MHDADAAITDATLARRAQAGDQAAFAQLARRYRPALVAVAFDRTRNLDDADDLAQEALARAWEHLADLREPGAFPSWLRAIAANLCATWTRASRPVALTDSDTDDADVVACAIRRLEQREIARALRELPPANRLALLMHVWHDMPYERIAAFLGVPVTTVEGRIFRARRQLRSALMHRVESLGRPSHKEQRR